jgi:hypothetical protein
MSHFIDFKAMTITKEKNLNNWIIKTISQLGT